MSKPVALCFTHGLSEGDSHVDAAIFIRLVKQSFDRSLENAGINPGNQLIMEFASWSGLVNSGQSDYIDKLRDYDLKWGFLRELIIKLLGDAATYHNNMYNEIHGVILDSNA